MKIKLENVSYFDRGVFVSVYEETTEYEIRIKENGVYFDGEKVGEIKLEDRNEIKGLIPVGYEACYNEDSYIEEDEFSIQEAKDEHEIYVFF